MTARITLCTSASASEHDGNLGFGGAPPGAEALALAAGATAGTSSGVVPTFAAGLGFESAFAAALGLLTGAAVSAVFARFAGGGAALAMAVERQSARLLVVEPVSAKEESVSQTER